MIDTTWLTVTAHTQLLSVVVATVVFLLNPRTGMKEFLLLGLLLLITLGGEIAGLIGGLIYRKNMNVMYNIILLFKIPLFLFFYKAKLNSRSTSGLVNVGAFVFVVFGVLDLIFIQKEISMTMYTRQLGNVLLILISIRYFYFLIKELPTERVGRLPMFWISTAVLIYHSGTFFQYLAADYLVQLSNNAFINTWTIHNFLGVVYYSMLAFGLWINRSALTQGSSAS